MVKISTPEEALRGKEILRGRVDDDSDAHESRIDLIFGQWCKRLRLEKGLRLSRAAQDAGIHTGRLMHLEHGTAARGATRLECQALAKVYGCDEDHVIRIAAGEAC